MKDQFVEKMHEISKKPYQKFFKKNKPYAIEKHQLLDMPKQSLGFHLGCFLIKYHLEIQPKLEDHDVIHVLTNTGISVPKEIGMQYYLFGNGKRSLYLFMIITCGTCFYPTRLTYFIKQFRKGKMAHQFHYLDFSKMLLQPLENLHKSFRIN